MELNITKEEKIFNIKKDLYPTNIYSTLNRKYINFYIILVKKNSINFRLLMILLLKMISHHLHIVSHIHIQCSKISFKT